MSWCRVIIVVVDHTPSNPRLNTLISSSCLCVGGGGGRGGVGGGGGLATGINPRAVTPGKSSTFKVMGWIFTEFFLVMNFYWQHWAYSLHGGDILKNPAKFTMFNPEDSLIGDIDHEYLLENDRQSCTPIRPMDMKSSFVDCPLRMARGMATALPQWFPVMATLHGDWMATSMTIRGGIHTFSVHRYWAL